MAKRRSHLAADPNLKSWRAPDVAVCPSEREYARLRMCREISLVRATTEVAKSKILQSLDELDQAEGGWAA